MKRHAVKGRYKRDLIIQNLSFHITEIYFLFKHV